MRPLVILGLIMIGIAAGAYMARVGALGGSRAVGIAVLPFDPMSTEEGDEAFADGLTEEIMDALGKVDGVRVPARSAAFALRGVEAPEAARRLGVANILEGSVRREGNRLRIRVELSGADGFKRWSQQYDRAAGDVFATWDEIALAVLDALEIELRPQELGGRGGGTSDLTAFQLYVRGRHAWFKRSPEGFGQALRYFQDAVALDPRYARAYTGLADAYNLLGAYDYGVMPPEQAFPLARAAAERALEIAPDLAEAHAALANTLFAYERDWEGAEAAYRRAIQLNPRYAEAHHWYGLFLIASGRPDESIEEVRVALALDSLSPVMRTSMARQLYFRGEYVEALDGYRTAVALDAGFVTARHGAGLALIQLGRHEQAAEEFRAAIELTGRPFPVTLGLLGVALARGGDRAGAREILDRLAEMQRAGAYVAPEYPAIIHLALGDTARAMDGLEAAYRARSGSVAFYGVEPLLAPLRGNPRFEALRQKVGLP